MTKYKTFKKILVTSLMAVTLCAMGNYNFRHPASAEAVESQAHKYDWKSVNITGGGYLPSVVFNESEKDLAYLRTDMGGAYRWDPNNDCWIPLTDWISPDDWNLLGCESIATDPIDTNRLYIVAGTYTNDWTNQNGYILRSTDKGETFEKIELPFKAGGNMPGRNMGERLMIDPNDNRILYLGARSGNGLWKSTDYGTTWNKVESFKWTGDFEGVSFMKDKLGVLWIQFDKNSSSRGEPTKRIYVGVANSGKQNTVFYSEDAGETWNPIEGQPTYDWIPDEYWLSGNYIPTHGVLASNGVLYITYCNQEGPYNGTKGGVWSYNTNTKEWKNITPEKVEDISWGYGGVAVDPVDPDTIMVTTMTRHFPEDNIFRSKDGGQTWKSLWTISDEDVRTDSYTIDYTAAPWLDWGIKKAPDGVERSPKLGWMLGDIKIDPFNSDHVLYGTGAILYGTENMTDFDKGKKVKLEVKAIGVEEVSVHDLISPPEGPHLISALADIGGFTHNDLHKSPGMPINPTISNVSEVDYAELKPSKIVRVGDCDTVGISYDGGQVWNPSHKSIDGVTGGGSVAISANGKTIVWSPSGNDVGVYYTDDDGENWNDVQDLPVGSEIISDRVNSDKFYGYKDGSLYISEDGGRSFTMLENSDLPNSDYRIKAMPGIEGDIWLVGRNNSGSGIWHSVDGGKTFEKLDSLDEAHTIGFGKAAPGKSYMTLYSSAKVDGINGIFRSDDKGKTWVRINDDDHQYGATNIAITGDPRVYGRVYVGTNGRGIVYADLKEEVR